MRGTIRRGGLMLCLAGVLMMTGVACQPASSTAPTTSKNKPADKKPDAKPSGPPKPDPG